MANVETIVNGTTADNFDRVLCFMALPENKQQEMLFSSDLIDSICQEGKYSSHMFAHNLEGDSYMRMRMRNFTLEYIVMKNVGTQDYNSYVHLIKKDGQLIYRRPDRPIGKIYVPWSSNIDT